MIAIHMVEIGEFNPIKQNQLKTEDKNLKKNCKSTMEISEINLILSFQKSSCCY